jgi:hypothetical protein
MRFIFLFAGLLFAAAALFCFIFPVVHAKADNAGILIIPGFFLAFSAWLSLHIFAAINSASKEQKKFKTLSRSEQKAYAERAIADMQARTREKISQDRKKASQFFTSSTERRKLRQSIVSDTFLLDIAEKMQAASKNSDDGDKK